MGTSALNPCGLVANSMFNDMIVVDSAPDPYNPLSPYDYMDESGISWVTGEITSISQLIRPSAVRYRVTVTQVRRKG